MNPPTDATAILLFAHGSSVEEANEGVRELARQVEKQHAYRYVRASFLEAAVPNLAQSVSQAAEAGFRRIVIIPYFLTLGLHLRRDLPRLVKEVKHEFPGLEIQVSKPLEGHPLMASIILQRVGEVSRKSGTS